MKNLMNTKNWNTILDGMGVDVSKEGFETDLSNALGQAENDDILKLLAAATSEQTHVAQSKKTLDIIIKACKANVSTDTIRKGDKVTHYDNGEQLELELGITNSSTVVYLNGFDADLFAAIVADAGLNKYAKIEIRPIVIKKPTLSETKEIIKNVQITQNLLADGYFDNHDEGRYKPFLYEPLVKAIEDIKIEKVEKVRLK